MKKFIELIKEENIFVPRNIEGRKEKIKQQLLKTLSQKVIEGDIEINCNLIPDNFTSKTEIINGNVDIINCKSLKFFKKLKEVNGFFECTANDLTSLEGSPEIVNGWFSCISNQLTSLKDGPKSVKKWFSCSFNQLTSLEGCPKTVGGNFGCSNNKVKFTKEDVKKYCKVGMKIFNKNNQL